MKLFVIDTETSDLDPSKGAAILEIAWIELSHVDPPIPGKPDSWEPTNYFRTYIQYDGPINPHAQASHHIRSDKLTERGGAVSREEAVGWLLKQIGIDSILVAHNVEFDSKFLPEIALPWICTYRTSKFIWPEAPGHSNQVLRYWLNIEPASESILRVAPIVNHQYPHQALYDVATTTGILQKMLERYTVDQLLHITRSPQRLHRMPFGKHKGSTFDKVPKDYMLWLWKQNNLDSDLKFTLDSILRA
jgi:exodeoxyribonuclease X